MSSTSETGHAKNVANVESLISFCTGYGSDYNPSKDNIKLPALNTLFSNAQDVLLTAKSAKTALDNASNIREIRFEPFKKLSTRILNALEATDASVQTINDAKTINRKIQGKRADNTPLSPGKKSGAQVPVDPNTKATEDKHISVSQQGFDNLTDHFTKMIQLISSEPLYNPNEADLKVASLNGFLTDLKTSNTAVITAATDYSNALIARDATLYEPKTGLVDIAQGIKKYIKSIFGASNPKYKQVSSLRFKKKPKE